MLNGQQILHQANLIEWPKNQWAIFGGGILAVRNIRETTDLDLVVTKELWERLISEGYQVQISEAEGDHLEREHLKINGLDIWYNLPYLNEDGNQLVAMAELIENIPFVPVAKLKEFKEGWRRDKDVRDLELIKGWEKGR